LFEGLDFSAIRDFKSAFRVIGFHRSEEPYYEFHRGPTTATISWISMCVHYGVRHFPCATVFPVLTRRAVALIVVLKLTRQLLKWSFRHIAPSASALYGTWPCNKYQCDYETTSAYQHIDVSHHGTSSCCDYILDAPPRDPTPSTPASTSERFHQPPRQPMGAYGIIVKNHVRCRL